MELDRVTRPAGPVRPQVRNPREPISILVRQNGSRGSPNLLEGSKAPRCNQHLTRTKKACAIHLRLSDLLHEYFQQWRGPLRIPAPPRHKGLEKIARWRG